MFHKSISFYLNSYKSENSLLFLLKIESYFLPMYSNKLLHIPSPICSKSLILILYLFNFGFLLQNANY